MNNGTSLKRTLECVLVFLLVGSMYYCAECVYKGALSHWTMFCLAGFVGVIGMLLNDRFTYEMDFLLQIFICTIVTVALEYIVGCIWNADYTIWDYRHFRWNLNGQICLQFSCLWAILFAIFIPVLDYVEWKVFGYKPDTPPYYKIFGKTMFRFR